MIFKQRGFNKIPFLIQIQLFIQIRNNSSYTKNPIPGHNSLSYTTQGYDIMWVSAVDFHCCLQNLFFLPSYKTPPWLLEMIQMVTLHWYTSNRRWQYFGFETRM